MKRINIALFIGLLVAFTYFVFEESYNDVSSLQSSVLRLHILANSDSDEDIALKYVVRDEILKETLSRSKDGINCFFKEGIAVAQNKFN